MQILNLPRILFCIAILLLGSNCVDDKTPQGRYEKISTAYCECTAQLIALNLEADSAGDAHLNEYFQKMEIEYNKAKECTATIIGQFGQLNSTELDSVNMLLRQKCPNLVDKRDLLQELLGE